MPRFVPSFLKSTDTTDNETIITETTETMHRTIEQPSRFGSNNVNNNGASRFNVNRLNQQTSFNSTNTHTDMNTTFPDFKNKLNSSSDNNNETRPRFAPKISSINNTDIQNRNRFDPIKDDKDDNKFPSLSQENKVNTMKPMTMAELTSLSNDSSGFTTVANKKKKTFGDRIKENTEEVRSSGKKLGLPPISLPKIASFDDFPSLSGTPKSGTSSPKKTPTVSSMCDLDSGCSSPSIKQSMSSSSFANLAKGWAKKTEDEQIAAELEKQRTEQQRLEEEAFRNNIRVFRKVTHKKDDDDFFDDDLDDTEYNNDNGFEDEDNYEVPSGDEDNLEPTDEEGDEYDPNYEQNPEKEYEERY
jgi:hypothetical protein